MKITYHVMSSPVGLLFLAGTPAGLRHLEFMDRKSLKRMIGSHNGEIPDAVWEPSLLGLKLYVDQLDEYFRGDRTDFTLALDPVGTPFQMQVWRALRAIPYGETRSYGDLARTIGQPRASRAVGLANHENPLAIVIPCHRVIGAGGSLVGYGGGLTRKKWLLDHEARFAHPIGRGDLFAHFPERATVRAGAMVAAAPARRSASVIPSPRASSVSASRRSASVSSALRGSSVRAAARAGPRSSTASRAPTRTSRAATKGPARRRRG